MLVIDVVYILDYYYEKVFLGLMMFVIDVVQFV